MVKQVIRLNVIVAISVLVASCSSLPSKVEDTTKSPSSYAVVTAGTVSAKGRAEKDYGRSQQVQVVEFWRYAEGNSDYTKVVREKCGKGFQSVISLPGTPYQLILLDGAIQPLILDSGKWVLWQIQGLGPHFPKARWIIPGDKQVTIRAVEGFADFDLIWEFNFSNPKAGFIVEYDSDWGW